MKFIKDYSFSIIFAAVTLWFGTLLQDIVAEEREGRKRHMTTCMVRVDLQAFPEYMRQRECHAVWINR